MSEDIVEEMREREQVPKEKTRKRVRVRRKPKPEPEPMPDTVIDILEEQVDRTDTTRHSNDAEFDLMKVEANPERYIEINIVKKSRVVDTFYIYADKPKFKYKNKTFNIKEDGIYLLPKKGFFVPTSFYYETKSDPIGFKQTNKGITGKAMTLLYKNRLYETLLKADDPNYNIFVILLLLAQLILFGVAMYFMYFHTGTVPAGGGVAPL
jgi:hypothetical protein